MGRLPRLKADGGGAGAWYHVYSGVSIRKGELPLADARCYRKLEDLFRFYSQGYCCGVGTLICMGTHYHSILKFEDVRPLGEEELWSRALALYPNSEKMLKTWLPSRWEKFASRLFDISQFMGNIQSAFATWYNRQFNRKGRLWADRFKSTLLLDSQSILDAMLYVDLNAVRAGLVTRPEDYQAGALYQREMGEADWLMPLSEVMDKGLEDEYLEYKQLLYYRGAVRTKAKQSVISPAVLAQEESKGFKQEGVYLNRFRHFTDGLALGAESLVREQLARLRESGHVKKRENVIDHKEGKQYTLRPQRETFVHLE